jgi:hypothetical protein
VNEEEDADAKAASSPLAAAVPPCAGGETTEAPSSGPAVAVDAAAAVPLLPLPAELVLGTDGRPPDSDRTRRAPPAAPVAMPRESECVDGTRPVPADGDNS